MDGEHCAEGETEEEGGGPGGEEGDLAQRLRTHRTTFVCWLWPGERPSLLLLSSNLLMSRQIKTLDHKPPMTQGEWDMSVLFRTVHFIRLHLLMRGLQAGALREECYLRGYTPQDDHEGLLWVLLCSGKG